MILLLIIEQSCGFQSSPVKKKKKKNSSICGSSHHFSTGYQSLDVIFSRSGERHSLSNQVREKQKTHRHQIFALS
jgi:hypothetical protein